jgi:hypothetical protein
LAGAGKPSPRYLVGDADDNGIGMVGCRHLSKCQWPALKTIDLYSKAITQGTAMLTTRDAGHFLRRAGRRGPLLFWVVVLTNRRQLD